MTNSLRIATWNINSVRARIDQLKQFLSEFQPDVCCLQEIKCQTEQFPHKALKGMGYDHHAIHGQKAYHGVAILSRLPVMRDHRTDYCQMGDARHVAAEVEAGGKPVLIHNYYVPAGGDEPDPARNPKFDHKLNFLDEMTAEFTSAPPQQATVLVGDLNIAPLETDVWSHKDLVKVVSHTPVEVDRLDKVQQSGDWVDLVRHHFGEDEKLYSWWSYRARDWRASNKGRRLDHIWGSSHVRDWLRDVTIADEVRGWEKASDHAPIIASFDLR